jgi:hypothetical protein
MAVPLSKKALLARDAKRDIGKELWQAIREVKAGKGKKYVVERVARGRGPTSKR